MWPIWFRSPLLPILFHCTQVILPESVKSQKMGLKGTSASLWTIAAPERWDGFLKWLLVSAVQCRCYLVLGQFHFAETYFYLWYPWLNCCFTFSISCIIQSNSGTSKHSVADILHIHSLKDKLDKRKLQPSHSKSPPHPRPTNSKMDTRKEIVWQSTQPALILILSAN